MSPKEFASEEEESEGKQWLYLIRHGDRWDYENPEWLKTTTRPGDPPLSGLGHQQARETGQFLDALLAADGVTASDLTWLSSPFLRTIQTSNEAISSMRKVRNASQIRILPEYSVFEWDGCDGKFHESLPTLEERVNYFPRLDVGYESLFVPSLPEPRDKFQSRCDKAIAALNRRFPFTPRTAVVVVTHAAACIGLARAAANLTLQDITPAAPCSIFRLTRRSDEESWTLDPHDLEGSLNGYSDHISDLGHATVPWNHFGDKKVNHGYTGPLNSRFAPKQVD